MKTVSWAVVTGASSGIGRAIAELFARDDIHLVLCARDSTGLQKVADRLIDDYGIQVIMVTGNFADPAIRKKVLLKTETLEVDYLVNSAGFGDYNPLINADGDRLQAMIDVNISALTELTQGFAQRMAVQKHGHILNVASTGAFLPSPMMAVYNATKAYVLNFSEAIAQELAPKGVAVTVLCPGPTKTQFANSAHAERTKLYRGMLPSAEEVAIFGYTAMKLKKRVAVHRFSNKIANYTVRLLPSRARTAYVYKRQTKGKN